MLGCKGHLIDNKYNKGFYLTLFNIFRIGLLFLQEAKQGSTNINISISIWRFGIHLHLVLSKENICREIK